MATTTIYAMTIVQSSTSVQFTPSEAARLTGVSPTLQRDWRRRGILQPKARAGHSRFMFSDLCRMVALKAFSDAGIGPKAAEAATGEFRDAESAASICMLPMLHFAGRDVVTTHPDHSIGRYVIVDRMGACRVATLSSYEDALAGEDRGPVSIIFDCKVAAEKLVAAIGRAPYEIVTTVKTDLRS